MTGLAARLAYVPYAALLTAAEAWRILLLGGRRGHRR